MIDLITITVANAFVFTAKLLADRAPNTCAAFTALLPYRQHLIHARWSGEACWIPLGDYQLGVSYENHTSHPSRGDLLWYPGGISETELLFAYGSISGGDHRLDFSMLKNFRVRFGHAPKCLPCR